MWWWWNTSAWRLWPQPYVLLVTLHGRTMCQKPPQPVQTRISPNQRCVTSWPRLMSASFDVSHKWLFFLQTQQRRYIKWYGERHTIIMDGKISNHWAESMWLHVSALEADRSVTCPSLYRVGILKWHTRDVAAKPPWPPVACADQPLQWVCVFTVHTVFYE